MAVTLSIKDVLGANVDGSTLSYSTDGKKVTVSSEGQYTYYATATLTGTLDGQNIGTGTQVFTLAKYNKPVETWADKYCFRSEGSYNGKIGDEDAKVYAFFTIGSGDVTTSGEPTVYSINNQVLGGLTISNIAIHRVLTDSLNEKLGETGVLNANWLTTNATWVSANVADVTQAYCEKTQNMTLAQSFSLNNDLFSQEQTYENKTATVAEVLAGATIETSKTPITLSSQNYDVIVDNAKEVSQYEGTDLAEIVTLKEGTVNVKDKNSEVSGNKYVSNADGKTYTVKSYALGNVANDTIYGTKGNDWINGSGGDDHVYGGVGGHDMVSGGTGDDTIIAGGIVTQKEATGADDGTELKDGYIKVASDYIKLNTTGSELYGDLGNDTIYSGMGNDFIWAAAGNDTINLNGGANSLLYSNLAYDATGFGQDTIIGATKDDTLEFFVQGSSKYYGYKLSDLQLLGTFKTGANAKADLVITAKDTSGVLTSNTITIKDFFVNDASGKNIANSINLNVLSENATITTVSGNNVNASSDIANVKYSTDGKVYVDNVSDYVGVAGLSEVVTLKKASKAVESYNSSADGKTYQIFAVANLSSGTVTDYVEGSASNDIITGGSGADTLLGGTAGHDIISGGAGVDVIVAGSKSNSTTDLNITELDSVSEKFYAKLNTTGSELNGGAGNDVIYSSKGNDFIAGNEGNDTINLNGGVNTLYFTETDTTNAFGNDTVNNAASKDVLQFFKIDNNGVPAGYKFTDLVFTKSGDDLTVTNANNTVGAAASSVLVKDFYKTAKVDTVIAANSSDIETTYSILKDAVINVGTVTGSTYTGSAYNENITMGTTDVTFTMGASNNTINYTVASMGNSVINLTKGENLNLAFTGSVTDMTYTINDDKDLIISIPSNGKTITLKSYMAGKTGANVQINGFDMFDWGNRVAAGLNNLSKDSTYDSEEAMESNGKLKGSDMSDYFNVADYVSDTSKGVTITSGGGDDTVVGSNYNDSVTIKSGNNTITETEGTNKVTTGAGDDTFTAAVGASSNTVSLGDGNNTAVLNSIGTNKITTGKGNDNITVADGTNTVKSSAGNNILALSGGVNNVTTGKGNDSYTLTGGENIIKSGAGSDKFTINLLSSNKIVASGSKNDASTFDISAGINNIKSGASSDTYNITTAMSTNTIDSGAGNDRINISVGSNTLKAGAGDDYLGITNTSTNIADMGAGVDTVEINTVTTVVSRNNIKLGAGNDFVTVGDATVAANSDASINTIDAGAGNDTITLYNGTNNVNAGAGNDTISITDGTNVVAGGAGNDTFKITGGANNINGGAGKDTYDLTTFNFAKDMIISDTSGISTFKFADVDKIGGTTSGTNYSFFANVTRVSTSVAKSGYIVDGYSIIKDTITAGAVTGIAGNEISVDLGKNKKAEFSVGTGAVKSVDIAKIAADVAGWLVDNSYMSVDDVFAAGSPTSDKYNFLATFAADKITA